MKRQSNNPGFGWLGPVLAAAALAAYLVTLSRGAFPGQSAWFVCERSGLFPLMRPQYPLWRAFTFLVTLVPLGSITLRLNVLSALCGAGAVWMTYAVMSRLVYILVDELRRKLPRIAAACALAGAAAAICLAGSIPFWIVSNRAHPASFHLLLLLVAMRLLLRFGETGSIRALYLFGLLYGLGVVEFATFIVLAPVAGALALVVMWQHARLELRAVLTLGLCALAGMLLYLVQAWAFKGSVGYGVTGPHGLFTEIWYIWRDQYVLIKYSLPKVGWLIVLCVTAVPWITCILVARRGLNEERDWGFYLLHLVVSALVVMVVLNLRFAPWSLLGFGRLLVTPYLLTAMVTGYLAAYWFLLPGAWWEHTEVRARIWLKTWMGPVFMLILFGVLGYAAVRNAVTADARSARIVNGYAEEVVDSLDGATWLITDGSVDAHVLLAAHARGLPLRAVDVRSMESEGYRSYLASVLETPRLRNAAQLGLAPLVGAWLEGGEAAAGSLRLMVMSDLWNVGNFTAVPHRTLFAGTRERAALDPAALLRDHEAFWDRADRLLDVEAAGALAALVQHYRRHVGLVANNLGVLLEDLGRQDEAYRAYAGARRLDPGNVSALLNQAIMVERGYAAADAASVRADLDRIAEALGNQKLSLWTLPSVNGYVRSPELLARVGWAWALAGNPGLAASGLRRAMEMVPESSARNVKQALAQVYLLQDEPGDSEAIYKGMLETDPNDRAALVGMSRIAMRRQDVKQARAFLSRAVAAGVTNRQIALDVAALNLLCGEPARARLVLEKLVKEDPEQLRAWVVLASIAVEERDETALRDSLRRVDDLERGRSYFGSLIRGQKAMREQKWEEAFGYLDRALTVQPRNAALLQQVLRLDMLLGRQEAARSHARRLLILDSRHAFANYVMGSIQSAEGDKDLAEDSLRRSLEAREMPEALNDLAWLLADQSRYDEAERLARRAVDLSPDMAAAWDTLGKVFLQTARPVEAREAFEKAFAFSQGNPIVTLHLAQACFRLGDRARADELVALLANRDAELPPDLRSDLDDLRRELL